VKALVTGGGGFLGAHLVRALRARGDTVRVLARGAYPELDGLGAESVRGDIRDAAAAARATDGVDVVFHVAAKAGGWGDARDFEATNVGGTENVVAACRASGVRTLVYTSSPSVVHADRDIEGEDESIPYATHFTAHYPRTKSLGEQIVRRAAGPELRTVSLRPRFIWGPGDRHLLPRLVARANAGRLRQIGTRDVRTDTIYIDNCVDAHLRAADAVARSAEISGRAYFVSDDDPIGVWTMARRLLAAVGAGTVGPPVPAWLAYAVGAALEGVHGAFGIAREPVITRFAATELSHAQWFDISAAKRDLGYAPRVSIAEGLDRLAKASLMSSAC
jgi:nucleoside-diphosphate-sugar epimerase